MRLSVRAAAIRGIVMKRSFLRISSIYGQLMAVIILIGESGVLFEDVNHFILTVLFIPLLVALESIIIFSKYRKK